MSPDMMMDSLIRQMNIDVVYTFCLYPFAHDLTVIVIEFYDFGLLEKNSGKRNGCV